MRKDRIARELTIEMIVGAFMVMIFLGLAYFTIILSREAWFSKKQVVEVLFDDVMGLREGDSVVVRGMPVGKVKQLLLQRNKGVIVVCSLDREDPLNMRSDYRITIVSTSILGGRYLEIFEGTDSRDSVPVGTVFHGRRPYDLIADASAVVNSIREALMDGGIISNLQHTVSDLAAVSERVSSGKGTLGKLLSADDTLYNDLSATVASLKEISGRLEKGQGTLGRLMTTDDQLYQDLSASVASLRSVAARIEKGNGTIGMLVQDEGLYKDVRSLVNEARAAVDDLRETSPITTFSSVFFGAF